MVHRVPVFPPRLRAGDRVGLTAPSSHQESDEKHLVEKAVKVLESWDLQVDRAENIDHRHFYLAGKDRERAEVFQQMYADPDLAAIFTTRGGYGATRMMSHLDPWKLSGVIKPLIGFSDVTALLLWLQKICGMVVFHGPSVATEQFLTDPRSGETRESLRQWLFNESYAPRLSVKRIRGGVSQGRLTGGCLSLITSCLGTSWEIETEGCILFLEDVNEAPYRVDRMLTQLWNAGKLEHIRGLVFGEMIGCEAEPPHLWQVLDDWVEGLKVPVVSHLASGHGPVGLTLALGLPVSLDADAESLHFGVDDE